MGNAFPWGLHFFCASPNAISRSLHLILNCCIRHCGELWAPPSLYSQVKVRNTRITGAEGATDFIVSPIYCHLLRFVNRVTVLSHAKCPCYVYGRNVTVGILHYLVQLLLPPATRGPCAGNGAPLGESLSIPPGIYLKCITPTVYRTLFICFWCLKEVQHLKASMCIDIILLCLYVLCLLAFQSTWFSSDYVLKSKGR